MTAELPEVAQTTLASPFLLNPQEVWYFSQVSYLLPRSSGRLLANAKLGQTFRVQVPGHLPPNHMQVAAPCSHSLSLSPGLPDATPGSFLQWSKGTPSLRVGSASTSEVHYTPEMQLASLRGQNTGKGWRGAERDVRAGKGRKMPFSPALLSPRR